MKALARFWPTATVVAVILYATWVPHPVPAEALPSVPHFDKLIHAVMFGGLAGAVMFDYHRYLPQRHPLGRRVILAVCIATALFSIVDEGVQGILPIGRPSDAADLLADWFGIIIAAAVAPPLIRRLFPPKS